MTTWRRILCPIDFSDHSRYALDLAVAIARSDHGSSVTALHVVPSVQAAVEAFSPVAVGPLSMSPADRDRYVAALRSFVDGRVDAGVGIQHVVCEGSPSEEIVTQASSVNADLIVLGTRGRSGFQRLLLGSVTERVIRKAACPVLTVPRQVADTGSAARLPFRRILCPVDFSETSRHALAYAASLAQAGAANLTVLHVISREFESGIDAATAAMDAGMTVGEFIDAREQALRAQMREVVATVEGCHADTLMSRGKAWREVLRVASDAQHDVVVIGVQGRGPLDLLFLGSTTQHVLRQAPCPVLTVRLS